MTPLKEPSRKPPPRTMLPQESGRTRMSKLAMCSVFFAAVAAITQTPASAGAEAIATAPKGVSYATSQLDKKRSVGRNDGDNQYGYRQTPPPGYYGNWGYAPGGYYWDRNYLWRRSLGFWDTNSPACPFRSC